MTLPKMHGVLVTYNRHAELETYLDRLRAQTMSLDQLIVVDNGNDPKVQDLVERAGLTDTSVVYVNPGYNTGPAGGISIGMRMLLDTARDEDWVFSLDDDDPPLLDDAIARSAAFARDMLLTDPTTGGVAPSGGKLNRRNGRLVRIGDEDLSDAVPVEHFPGNGFPCYRVAAIRQVGTFNADLFFGFEELDYGLRMTSGGFTLYADGRRLAEIRALRRKLGLMRSAYVKRGQQSQALYGLTATSWRRYYSLRNLIYILRENGAPVAATRITIVRGILKPIANMVVDFGHARHHLRLNWRAMRDGWAGDLGLTVDPSDSD